MQLSSDSDDSVSGVRGSSKRQKPVQYIHSDDENSEHNHLQSEPRRERCDDEEVSYSTLYCVYVYVLNVTLYIYRKWQECN